MNLFFQFHQAAERRSFVARLLLGEVPEGGMIRKSLEKVWSQLEGERRNNPFFRMEKTIKERNLYWNPSETSAGLRPEMIFLRGIRSIHTQKSHLGHKGLWLVLGLRDTKPGILLFESLKNEAQDMTGQLPRISQPLPWHPVRYPETLETWNSMYGYAQTLMQCGKLSEAMEILLFIYYNMPWYYLSDDRIYLWEELAFELETQDRMQDAELALRIQSSLQPKSTDPFLNLGTFHLWRENYAEATNVFLEGLCRNPTDEYLQYNLATVYSFWNDDEAILDCLNMAIMQFPDSGVLWKFKGDLHFERGRLQDAKRCYHKALRFGLDQWPELQVSTLNNLGLVEADLGEVQQAVNNLEKALQLDATNVDCLMNLSSILGHQAGDYEKARRTAQKAVRIDPANARARHNLGITLMQGNVLPEAEWHLRKARQLDPQFRAARETLAECLRRRRGSSRG